MLIRSIELEELFNEPFSRDSFFLYVLSRKRLWHIVLLGQMFLAFRLCNPGPVTAELGDLPCYCLVAIVAFYRFFFSKIGKAITADVNETI